MKNITRIHALKIMTLGAAVPGFLLRSYLYASAVDQKGLIISGHWATRALAGLTLLFLTGLLLLTSNPKQEVEYQDCFAPSVWRGCGALAAATAILLRVFRDSMITPDPIHNITSIMGVAAGIGLLVAGICRLLGTKPHFLCHSAGSLYFATQLVSLYRGWSSDPQLMNYGFYLAAFVCLMLTAYFLAQFHVNTRDHKSLWFTAMAAVYFCAVAIPESGDGYFLLACALWAFLCPPRMDVKPRRQRPAMNMNGED